MPTPGLVERDRQRIAGNPPTPDMSKLQRDDAAQLGHVEILMRDGISPFIEQFQRGLANGILRIKLYHMIPKFQPEASKVGSDISWIWVPFIELSSLDELGLQNRNQLDRRHALDQAPSTFGMQVATKALELRRQQDCERMIQLLSGNTPALPGAADRSVCRNDLVERGRSVCSPSCERTG